MEIYIEEMEKIDLSKKNKNNKYYRDFKEYHVLTSALIFMSMLFILFSNDNPVVIGSVYVFIISIIASSKDKNRFKTGFVYFIPIAILIIIINMFFVTAGSTTLFYLFHKRFTLESIIYAAVMAFKLLAVTYLFLILEIMLDSDKAVSYFSAVMPKSTLMLMTAFKLIPSMRERFKNLKEIYQIRGVKFNKKKAKENTESYIPVLSILLEDSMEGSFAIGEAAFVRGFLSGSRSIYERQKFQKKDFILIALDVLLSLFYAITVFKKWVEFKIYDGVTMFNYINIGIAILFTFIVVISFTVVFSSKEKSYEIYRD